MQPIPAEESSPPADGRPIHRPSDSSMVVNLRPPRHDPDIPWVEITKITTPGHRIISRKPQLPPRLPPFDRIVWPPIIFRPPRVVQPTSPVEVPAQRPIDPSLVLKAYSTALRPFLTLESDLSRAHQAIFIANPLQYGIPSGLGRDEYLNEAIFGVADPVQNPQSPAFSRAGTTFFEWLQSYVINVKDAKTASTEISVGEAIIIETRKKEARDKYEAANNLVSLEYENMFKSFTQAHDSDKSLTLMDWINNGTGDAYRNAVEERASKSNDLKALQTTGMPDVIRRRETLDSAMARAELKQGNNMPCTLRDLDADTSSTEKLPPAGIIYRPLHYLSGYDVASTRWVMDYPNLSNSPQKLLLDLKGAADVQWKDLGFPHLDSVTPALGGIPGFEVWLEFTGIASFDVFRGLWDINGFRDILPPLLATAVPALKNPILKTIKVLVGYDVDVVIKLPKPILESLPTEGTKVQLPPEIVSALSDLVGYLPATVRENGEVHARSDKDNAYPALLAVLAQSV